MIKRIVKLSFQKAKIVDFLIVFEASKSNIRNFEGCFHLELLRSKSATNVFFTFSMWKDEAALNEYRHSSLFKATWEKTKILFNDKPQAWSVDLVDMVEK